MPSCRGLTRRLFVDVHDLVTVVPNDPSALSSVDTPFVAFEHPFKDCAGRFERQINSIGRYNAAVLLGDTWPDTHYVCITSSDLQRLYSIYRKPQDRWTQCLWPETAIYTAGVAKFIGVNPGIHYRPQLWTFCRYIELCSKNGEDIDILSEGTICVKNRSVYPLAYPVISLSEEKCRLTILYYGDQTGISGLEGDDTQLIYMGAGKPDGATFNLGLAAAHGRFIAVCREGDEIDPDRFKQQIKADADLVMCPVEGGGSSWLPYRYTHRVDEPSEQLSSILFRREIFEHIGAAHPTLTVGFEYDLFVRIVSDKRMSIVNQSIPLVRREKRIESPVYAQQVYNDAANRVRYSKDYHAPAIR